MCVFMPLCLCARVSIYVTYMCVFVPMYVASRIHDTSTTQRWDHRRWVQRSAAVSPTRRMCKHTVCLDTTCMSEVIFQECTWVLCFSRYVLHHLEITSPDPCAYGRSVRVHSACLDTVCVWIHTSFLIRIPTFLKLPGIFRPKATS